MATIAIRNPWRHDRAGIRTTWLRRLRTAERWIHRARCALTGHDFLIHREPQRMCLECTHCGRQTRGWLLAPREEASSPAAIASNRGKFGPRLVESDGTFNQLPAA